MSDETRVIDAKTLFRPGIESDEERKQALKDGASALEKLKACRKLGPGDRENIARGLGLRIHSDRVDRSRLAKHAGLEPKELYRLVLRPDEEIQPKDTYRLRANGKKYADVIESLAVLLRRTKVADLADRILRGTSIHPAASAMPSGIDGILRDLYSLADGVDQEFALTPKFAAIARLKRGAGSADPWSYWPAHPAEPTASSSLSDEEYVHSMKGTFWGPAAMGEYGMPEATWDGQTDPEVAVSVTPNDRIGWEYAGSSFWFPNDHWDRVVGYLPHFFLGHKEDFCFDADFWPAPPELATRDHSFHNDEQWMARLAERMFDLVGHTAEIHTEWKEDGTQFLFNGEPADAYRRRIYRFQAETAIANWPPNAAYELDDPLLAPWDPPAFFWLCLYPNADGSALVPVLMSTGWMWGADNAVELIDERLLSRLARYPVLGGETLGLRLEHALRTTNTAGEVRLIAEWRRTAKFVERHPLWRRDLEYQAAASQIRKYGDQILTARLSGSKTKETR